MSDDIGFDVNCDPKNPRKINYDGILAASRRLAGCIIRTPCPRAHMSEKLGMELYMKQEFLQYTGSFKERGVRNALLMLNDEQKKHGVAAASTGNHGSAMSYHSTKLGIPCVVVMPLLSAITKINRCQQYGAKIILHGSNIMESRLHALAICREKKMTYINGYDHPNALEGQGSAGLEILEQVPDVEAILIPTGGGSLLSGVSVAVKHLKPEVQIYGCETDKTCSMTESLKKNERTLLDIGPTIADGLAVSMVGVNSFHNIKGHVDKMIVVKEDWVARALLHIVEVEKLVVEGSGAVPIAAIMAGLLPNLKGKKVACIMSGGNIDTTILARALERGMAAEGRLVKFKVTVCDRPGGMSELCSRLAEIGVTLRDCVPERAWVKGDVFSVQLKLIAETRGWDHTKKLVEMIKKNYKEHFFQDMNGQEEKPTSTRRGACSAPNPTCMQK